MLAESRTFIRDDAGRSNWLSLLLTPEVFVLILQYFCFSFVWYFYITWLPTYLRETRAQSPAQAAAFATLPLLFGGFGSIATGLVATRLPGRVIAFFGFLGSAMPLFAFTRIRAVLPAMVSMGLASFCSDLTMPISWNACVEIGGPHTATVAAAMNMMGNFAGFVAPVLGGLILQRTGGDWNPLIYLMIGAAMISALSWIYLDPAEARNKRGKNVDESLAQISADDQEP